MAVDGALPLCQVTTSANSSKKSTTSPTILLNRLRLHCRRGLHDIRHGLHVVGHGRDDYLLDWRCRKPVAVSNHAGGVGIVIEDLDAVTRARPLISTSAGPHYGAAGGRDGGAASPADGCSKPCTQHRANGRRAERGPRRAVDHRLDLLVGVDRANPLVGLEVSKGLSRRWQDLHRGCQRLGTAYEQEAHPDAGSDNASIHADLLGVSGVAAKAERAAASTASRRLRSRLLRMVRHTALGRVDGFNQHQSARKTDDG
jgi:hypothetical protein